METTFETEELGKCRTRIKFSVPHEKVKSAIDRAFDKVKGSTFVPGFRPGRAPRPMIENRYGKVIEEEAFSKLLPECYYDAVKEKKLHPINEPNFDDVKYEKGQPLTFAVTVEILPDFTLPDYKSIEIKKAEVKELSEEDIQKIIDIHREHHAKYEPVEDRGVEEGDFVLLNIDQEIEDRKNSQKNQLVKVDKETIFPEFVEKLVGMKPVAKAQFHITFPDDYKSKEVAGKTVHYEIELLEIKRKVLPEVDDDFAKDTGRAETFEDLKEDIRKSLRHDNEEQAHLEEENRIIDAIVDMSGFEIPPSMMEMQIQNNVRRAMQYSIFSGIPSEELIGRKEEIHKKASEDSEKQIKLFLLVRRIAEAEDISIEDEDINSHIENIAQERKMDVKELTKKMQENDEIDAIRNRLLHDRVLKFLHENAKKN